MNIKVTMIAAAGNNGEIGVKNRLLWHIPEDLKFFKDTTLNKAVVMGWNTFSSIGKPLKNRFNIVVTDRDSHPAEGVVFVRSLREAYDQASKAGYDEVFNIGGAKTYSEGIVDADQIILTNVKADFPEADAFFPKINPELFSQTNKMEYAASGYEIAVIEYKKRPVEAGWLNSLSQDMRTITNRLMRKVVVQNEP
jgi:dihydrofolate reductase